MSEAPRKGKKLPKRTSRPAHKERRQRSWLRGERRKTQRREAQDKRHAANLATGDSPWSLAKSIRFAARHGGAS